MPKSSMLALVLLGGCYHYRFVQELEPAAAERVVVHEERVPTYVNGFVGTGTVETDRFCAEPVSTELKVTAADVLISVFTLLVYTPHTLYVVCPAATEQASLDGNEASRRR